MWIAELSLTRSTRARARLHGSAIGLVITLVIVGALALVSLSCGGRDKPTQCDTDPSTDDDAGDLGTASLTVTSALDPCTDITLSVVGPNTVKMGEKATLVAHAANAKRTRFTFAWTASSGKLSQPKAEQTDYTCATSGQQQLQLMAAEDNGCTHAMTLPIECVSR